MNTDQGQMAKQPSAQGQPQAGAVPQQRPGQQPGRQPMYQPSQIRSLPTLSEEEKDKYEKGLAGLWARVHNSAAGSEEHNSARKKIIEFSTMLISKIQQRRSMHEARLRQQQQQQQGGPAPVQTQAQNPQQSPNRPGTAQQNSPNPGTSNTQQGGTVAGAGAGAVRMVNSNNQTENGAPPAAGTGLNPVQAVAAAGQQQKLAEIERHIKQTTWRAPPGQIASKSPAEIAKYIEDLKEKYKKALILMEKTRAQVQFIDQQLKSQEQTGVITDEDRRHRIGLKEQYMKSHKEAKSWVEGIRKQQASLDPTRQAAAAAQSGGNVPPAGQPGSVAMQGQKSTQGAPTQANADAAKNNQNSQNTTAARPAPPATAAVGQAPPVQTLVRPTAAPHQPQPQAQQQQPQAPVATQQQSAPVNGAAAAMVNGQNAANAVATPPPGAPLRANAPQPAASVTAAGPTRALSHSMAMSLANQRATGTPGGTTAGASSQPGASTPTSATGVNQNVVNAQSQQQQQQQVQAQATQLQQQQQPQSQQQQQPQSQPQQGTPQQASQAQPLQQQSAHSTSSHQPTLQSKMPIPKQLPEKATTVPVGVTVGGGVNTGRPTMTQGSGTLGGVMNQPALYKVPAYSHEAEGDHVLSKKKLDELVRQVCGGSVEGQDGNLLTPEVEEVSFSLRKVHRIRRSC